MDFSFCEKILIKVTLEGSDPRQAFLVESPAVAVGKQVHLQCGHAQAFREDACQSNGAHGVRT